MHSKPYLQKQLNKDIGPKDNSELQAFQSVMDMALINRYVMAVFSK